MLQLLKKMGWCISYTNSLNSGKLCGKVDRSPQIIETLAGGALWSTRGLTSHSHWDRCHKHAEAPGPYAELIEHATSAKGFNRNMDYAISLFFSTAHTSVSY